MALTSLAEPSPSERITELGARAGLRLPQAAALATALTVVGIFSLFTTAVYLWSLWTTDPLKSIGGFIPIVSLVLILRVWRSLGWEMEGTWWGLLIVAVTIALVHIRDRAIMEFIISPSWSIFLPPHSLVAFAYAAGAVLLFGGVRLFRAGLFPVVLMWFVNPVPNFFSRFIDLPLQRASALTARAFAHGMGQKLSPDQLRLMFTPDFGMFIAPGCNGIRGAITMGFIALIAGYIYKFRARVWAAVVVGAILLGYVFNLVRLCVLVLYYIVALHIPWLQSRAEMGDYIIGACLFFVATTLLFTLIRRWSPTHDLKPPPLVPSASAGGVPRTFGLRWAGFALVLALGSMTYARGLVRYHDQPVATTDPKELGKFPKQIGTYTLQREWNEYLVAGPLIFYWADYAPADGGPVVSVGLSPVLGAHDSLLCHSARGEDWLWHGNLDMATAAGVTSLSGSFYNGGATQYLEATTICVGATCGQYSTNRKHFGFIYSRPDTRTLLSPSPSRAIPILLRTETADTALNADAARTLLTANLRNFLAGASLPEFTKPYRE